MAACSLRGGGALIERALAIFRRPETAELLLRDAEWDEGVGGESEGRLRSLSGDNGDLCVAGG